MDYEKLAARCVIAGIQGPTPTPEELDLVRRGIAGVILFKRNVVDPAQVAELSRALKAAAPGPLLLSIDQEGGRVQRLRAPHWTELPSMRRIGELDAAGGIPGMNGTAIAEKLGLLIAEELSACGIDQDYAPVLDVDTNPDNPVIGDRSFGRDPARVARLGVALGKGLETGRVASCGKHFPGHGDTSQDSHLPLPRLAHERERLAEAAARMEKLLQFARPSSAVEPSRAAARCGTKEHRDFVAKLMAVPAVAAQHRDPTEWRRA